MQRIHGFTEHQTVQLPEYRATGGWFVHDKTGCEVFHVFNDDEENFFAFAFKTIPEDSTGIAHILEHTVLSGSKRFPIKDPFLLLMKGSLQTFLNAFTFPDKTVYPASSPVEQDLFNLMRVYGDAVFFPLLREDSFRQEGHRLEFDADGALQLNGVVYHEMRGNYANHDSIAAEWSLRSVAPDTPYAYDSGGDPEVIPQLTFEQFLAFHQRYYHPSNTRIFLYGNIPTERYLEFIDTTFLGSFDRLDPPAVSLEQPMWDSPRSYRVSCPADGEDATTSVTVNWLLDPITDPVTLISAELLGHILLATSGSPLRKRLIESGLGDDLSAPSGLESEVYQMVFSVGLRGTSPDATDEVVSVIMAELDRIVIDGIDPNIVEGALRTVEFRNREIRGGVPNGLRLMRKSMRGWLHGQSPETTLRFNDPFAELRSRVAADDRYFEGLVHRWLIDNQHRATVTVFPDHDHARREQERLQKWLDDTNDRMDKEQKAATREAQERLLVMQQTPDDEAAVRSIPFLSLSDIPRSIQSLPIDESRLPGGVPLYTHDLYTNGIVYLDLAFDVSGVPSDLVPYLGFYSSILTEMGLPGRSFDHVATEIELKTGGVGGLVEAGLPFHEPRLSDRRFIFRLRALEGAFADAIELMRELLTSATLDNGARITELLRESRSDLAASLIPAGTQFAGLRSRVGLSDAAYYHETWRGISQLLMLRELDPAADAPRVGDALRRINDQVIRTGNLTVNLAAEGQALTRALSATGDLVSSLPVGGFSARVDAAPGRPVGAWQESVIVPSGVNYVAATILGSRFGSPEQVHESVLAHLLNTGYLWQEIRMTGGAYGAGAHSRGMDALFSFGTYRDPRLVESVQAFRTGLERYAAATPSGDELEPALIGVAGDELKPLSPAEKSWTAFKRSLFGITDELRQSNRDQLFSSSGRDIRQAAERLLSAFPAASVVVVGGRDAIERAGDTYPGLTENTTEVSL